ncbi:MAG TPA: GNAT family N-acetyltransferase [Solirubrobacteraceae bacterium]|nr:GNAT family N-acetyltransferase [Solirubrobacteraceae bacterium]
MPDWIIRNAAERDIDAVLALWAATTVNTTVTDTSNGLCCLLANDEQALLLAQAGESLVGSLIAAWDGWRASFYRLAVHPDRRREGIATALLREGERRLCERGAVRLTAIVTESDPVAMGFWQSAGYSAQADRARFVRHIETPPPRA